MEKVLIVIPAYNAEKYIGDTLRSVLNSTYENIVVVVVNDGSTDKTEVEAKKFDDERLVVISRPNSGMSASRNFGIETFDTDFIALVDSDDIWHPRKIEIQVDVMRQNQDVGFCYSDFIKYWGGETSTFENSIVSNELDGNLSGYIYHKMLLTNWALPSSVMFRRSLWHDLGPFLCDDQQTDDWEYFVRASRLYKFAKLKASMVLYRQPPDSLSRRVPKKNSTEEMRADLIRRFGLISPQGEMVNASELENRIHKGLVDYFDMQLSRGDLKKGMSGFIKMLFSHPKKIDTAIKFSKSMRRRIIR